MSAADIKRTLKQLGSPERAQASARFFKTGPGEYGAGDRFIGVSVPLQRVAARQFEGESLVELSKLLRSGAHEERLTALFILVKHFDKARSRRSPDPDKQAEVCEFYLQHLDCVNNWDLVDSSAPQILGEYLLTQPVSKRRQLVQLSQSKNQWQRRVAVLTTQAFIRERQFDDTLKLARQLLGDSEDLIHKAVGWMLREIGNRDVSVLRSFLDEDHSDMPRTMLRYAIEKLAPAERKRYMAR